MLSKNRGAMDAGFHQYRVDSEGRQFEAISIGQSLQRELAATIRRHAGDGIAAGSGADVDQQSAALPPHRRQYRAVDPHRAIEVDIEDALELLDGESFRQPQCSEAGIIDDHVDAPGHADRFLDG